MRTVLVVTAILMTVCWSWSADAVEDEALFPVRVQLKWFHRFQFAGYYAALENDYFREAGLDVTLIEGGPHINPTQTVLAGDAEFGIGTSGLLVTRSKGQPIVAVAAIFQHSPYILITRDDPDIRTPRDLEGKTIMVEPYAEELIAYLQHEGVDIDAVNLVEHGGSPLDIFSADIIGTTAYTTTDPYILKRSGQDYRVFDPKVAGIDFYGDTLFTTETFARKHNDKVVVFRDALIKGWRYALRNPVELITLIETNFRSRREHGMLSFEAEDIRRLLIPDLIELGYMNPERWKRIAAEFRAAELLESEVNIDDFIFRPDEETDWTWLFYTFFIAGTLTLLVITILAKFYSLNRHLKAENQKRIALEEELKRHAVMDFGTGVFNRRGFLEAMNHELIRAERKGAPLSLMEFDVDYFKRINDTCGHAAGDRALAMVASVCRETVRGIDIIGRMGSEEFMIVLTDTHSGDARLAAERLLHNIEASVLLDKAGEQIAVTVSMGVATLRENEDIESIMQRADQAMYRAKELGRNRVVIHEDMIAEA